MPYFKLTSEQKVVIATDLNKAEKREGSGTLFGHIYICKSGETLCRCHYIDEARSVEIQKILSPGTANQSFNSDGASLAR